MIINSTTNLNKLKFSSTGGDRWDQGKSGQPYIKKQIPGVDYENPAQTFATQLDDNPLSTTGVDFLTRGGLLAVDAAADDVSRLSKLFFDTKSPNGFEFIAKQNVLSRQSVKTEATIGTGYGFGGLNQGTYLPFNTLLQVGLDPVAQGFTNLFGVNPRTDNTPVTINDGVFTQQLDSGLNAYYGVVGAQNSDSSGQKANRLYRLLDSTQTQIAGKTPGANIVLNPDGSNQNILEYKGGPGSIILFGKTKIPFVEPLQRTGQYNSKIKASGFYNAGFASRFLGASLDSPDYRPSDGNYGVFTKAESYFTTGTNFDQNNALGASSFYTAFGATFNLLGQNSYINRFSDGTLEGYKAEVDIDSTSDTFGQPIQVRDDVNEPNRVSSKNYTKVSNNANANNLFLDVASPGNFNILNTASPTLSAGIYGGSNVANSGIIKGNIFVSGSTLSGIYDELFPKEQLSSKILEFNSVVLNSSTYAGQTAIGGDGTNNQKVYNFNDETKSSLGYTNLDIIDKNNTRVDTQAELYAHDATQTGTGAGLYNPNDFRKELIDGNGVRDALTTSTILSISPDYQKENQAIRTNLGDPGQTAGRTIDGGNENPKNVLKYGVPANTLIALDRLNALAMYENTTPDPDLATTDSVNFNIAVINNDKANGVSTYLHFRAFLDEFNDNYTAKWDSVQYVGRGEELYNYSGFGREISMGWTVYAQSKAELIPMYKKLNYLASSLAPDYSDSGFMRGNIVKITVGGYIYDQPGIIKSISYTIPEESPWEIAIGDDGKEDTSVKQLSHMIKVTGFQFVPIQKFVPQIVKDLSNPREKYIALANQNGDTNYSDEYVSYNQLGAKI